MAWDGSGNFVRTNGTNTGNTLWQDDRDDGVNIRADRHDVHDEDIAGGLENTIARDGQNTTQDDQAILKYESSSNAFVKAGEIATDAEAISATAGKFPDAAQVAQSINRNAVWMWKQSATFVDSDSITTDTTTTDDAGENVWHVGRRVRIYLQSSDAYRYATVSSLGTRGASGQVNLVDIVDGSGASASLLNEDLTVWVEDARHQITVDSVSDLQGGTFPSYVTRLWLSGYYGVGTPGGGPLYRDADDTSTSDNGGTVFVDSDGVRWKRPQKELFVATDFGAATDGTTDDTNEIQAALDTAGDLGRKVGVVVGGDGRARTTGTLKIPTNVFLLYSEIYFDPATSGTVDAPLAAIQLGESDGSELIRPAGAVGVTVYTDSTQTNLVGFRMYPLVRASTFQDCRASMLNGDATDDRNHVGFEIRTVPQGDIAAGGNNGSYQNRIVGCSAYNSRWGYWLDTINTADGTWAPQSNGNIIDSVAYSCLTGALYLGAGAQDNRCRIRADTFIDQIGDGTTVSVVRIVGNFNEVDLSEEIGARGDTQYSVDFQPDATQGDPIYNHVRYLTQQTVTATVNHGETDVSKNSTTNVSPLKRTGGSFVTIGDWDTFSASFAGTVSGWVAPRKCVIKWIAARAGSSPASHTRIYFAKNGSRNTSNRIVFDSGDAAGTSKVVDNDPTSSAAINSQWELEAGDYLQVYVEQDGSGGNNLYWSAAIQFME